MEITLRANARSETGKGHARRARASGMIPGVLYGATVENTPVSVDARTVLAALQTEAGHNVLINLDLDGKKKYLTVLREIQRNPVKGTLIHVDFLNVARDVVIHTTVPIHLVGESRGVKEGGAVEHHMWELLVEALPTDVPPSLEIDISDLGIGDSVRVSDVVSLAGVKILTNPEELVAAVVEPQLAVLPEPEVEVAEVEEGAEPAAEEGEGAAAPEEKQAE